MSEFDTTEVRCPSGLTGLVRPLLVGDMSALTSRSPRQQKQSDTLGQLFRNVWKKTTELGALPDGTPGVAVGESISNWGNVFLGDRSFLLFELRRITYGDEFHFSLPCPSCKTRIDWMINLNDVEVSGFSKEMSDAISEAGADAVLYRTLPCSGVKVGFSPMLGSTQRKIASAQSQGEGAVGEAVLLSRLTYIEDAKGPGDRRKSIKGMHLLDLEYLKNEWDEADIFVQDTIEIECSNCGAIPEVTVPVDDRFFSAKSARPRRGKS